MIGQITACGSREKGAICPNGLEKGMIGQIIAMTAENKVEFVRKMFLLL